MAADGVDGPAGDGVVDNRGALDVPEWVSELRRLYVEPKTRAKLRQEGTIAPQKRRLGLPGGRGGSRRGSADAPAVPGRPTEEQTARAAAVPVPVALEALRPPVFEQVDPPPLLDESGVPHTAADRTEEEKVSTWLTSYLVATGHAADDETAAVDTGEPGSDRSPVVPRASTVPADHAGDTAAAAPADGAPAAPLDVPAPIEVVARDPEPAQSHLRSLVDLADLSEPDSSPAGDLASEPWRPAHDGAGVLVSTGGDAATPNPAATSRPESDLSRPRVSPDPEPAPPDQPLLLEEPLVEPSVEPPTVRGRPSSVPAVTLSWREAESFEIGVPGVGDSEGAIVVEPPSQLVAERRSRRRDLDTEVESESEVDPVVVEPLPAPVPVEVAPATRASARAASGYRSGKRRRVMVVGLVLVLLAIAACYFVLRGDGGDAAVGSTARTAGSHSVVTLSATIAV